MALPASHVPQVWTRDLMTIIPTTPAIVEAIARTHHVDFTRSPYAASVELGGVVYFWAAA